MSVQALPVQAEKQREIVSYDPGTGAEIGRAPLRSSNEVKAAAERARAAQPAWEAQSFANAGASFCAHGHYCSMSAIKLLSSFPAKRASRSRRHSPWRSCRRSMQCMTSRMLRRISYVLKKLTLDNTV